MSASALHPLPSSARRSLDGGFPGDGCYADKSQHVHDPTVVRVGDRWFCLSTSGDGMGVLRSSTDLARWVVHGPLLPEHPEWLARRYSHRSIWAPDILVLEDRLRVYYCASHWGTNESVIGLLECIDFDLLSPTQGWVDRGLVMESRPGIEAFNAIDAEALIDTEGRHWLFFGSYFAGIQLIELDPATGHLLEGASPRTVACNRIEPNNAIEGAAVCFRKGFYYLFVSYGLAAQGVASTYRIMVGRSRSPQGPYVDAHGVDMVDGGHVNVLKSSAPMFAPGHCDVFGDELGRYWMPYHFYDGRAYWMDGKWGMPTLQIRELLWSEDGWPLPGLPVEFSLSPGLELAGRWVLQEDFTEPVEMRLHSGGTIESPFRFTNWTSSGDSLWLHEPGCTYQMTLNTSRNCFAGRNSDGMVIRAAQYEGD